MSDILFTESSIEDSYVYKTYNAANGLIERILTYIRNGVVLDSSYYEELYYQLKRTPITPLTKNVVEALENGSLQVIYSKDAKVGTSIPFVVRKDGGKIVSTVFISSFANIDQKTGQLNIPLKKFYGILEPAYVALMMQSKELVIRRNMTLAKYCMAVYSQMISRILNKDYQIVMDKTLYDKVQYSIQRFFLEKVWGLDDKNAAIYAKNNLKFISEFDLSMLVDEYENAQISDINEFLMFIKTFSPRMESLTTRYFLERYITAYHGSAILSIDYLPYLFFVIENVLIGSFLLPQAALNEIVKISSAKNFYTELSKIL